MVGGPALVEKEYDDFKGSIATSTNNRCKFFSFCCYEMSWEDRYYKDAYSFKHLWEANESIIISVNMKERTFTVKNAKDTNKCVQMKGFPDNRRLVFEFNEDDEPYFTIEEQFWE